MSAPHIRIPACRPSAPGRHPGRAAFTMVELLIVISVIAALAAMGFPIYKAVQNTVYKNSTNTLVQAVAAAITDYGQSTWTWRQRNKSSPDPKNEADWTLRTAYLWDMNQWQVTKYASLSGPAAADIPAGKILTGEVPDTPTPLLPIKPSRFRFIDGRPQQSAWAAVSGSGDGYTNPPLFNAAPQYQIASTDTTENFDGPFDSDLVQSGYTGFYDMCQPSISKKFVNKRHQIIDAWGQPLRIAYAAKTYGASSFGVWSAGPNMVDASDVDTTTGLPIDVYPSGKKEPSDDITSWKNN